MFVRIGLFYETLDQGGEPKVRYGSCCRENVSPVADIPGNAQQMVAGIFEECLSRFRVFPNAFTTMGIFCSQCGVLGAGLQLD